MRVPSLLALLSVFVFCCLITALVWIEHQTFNSTSLDLGVYTQLAWNGAHGQPFSTTLLLQNRLHLAEHLALLLLPLAPLYALSPDPRSLLLLQQAALACAGLPVYWLARRRLGPGPALLPLVGYLAMPVVGEVALDAFYPIVIAALPVAMATALALDGRPRAAGLLALLALLIEEEAALPLLGLGSYLVLRRGNRQLGLTALGLSAIWLMLAQSAVMPRFGQPSSNAEATRAEVHFGELQTAPLAWLGTVALNRLDPDLVKSSGLGRLVGQPSACPDAGHCSALRWWLYPTAGLALLSPPTLLMSAPTATALLAADKPGRFRRHWAAPMLPVIWLAVVIGLARFRGRPAWLSWSAALALGLATSASFALDGSLPGGSQFEAGDLVLNAAGADLETLAALIPEGASATSSRRALGHLANRSEIYVFPPKDYSAVLWPPDPLPDFVLVDLRNGDSARELDQPSTTTRWRSAYDPLDQRPSGVLLRRR